MPPEAPDGVNCALVNRLEVMADRLIALEMLEERKRLGLAARQPLRSGETGCVETSAAYSPCSRGDPPKVNEGDDAIRLVDRGPALRRE